jgi:hypothetical protein
VELPLYVLDMTQFRWGRESPATRIVASARLSSGHDEWIIDGFGGAELSWERFAAAETLIYVDLLIWTHYRW